jgi:hypothetical protein
MKILTAAVVAFTLTIPALASEDHKLEGLEETGTPDEIMETLENMIPVPNVLQNCYSARSCRGKILSHRDAHNCKVKSRGKSWSNNQGKCYNL